MKLFGVSLSALLLLSGSSLGSREEEIRRFNTPFVSCGSDPSGKGSCLVLDKTIYQSLLQVPVDTLVEFNQFQTERNARGILRLKRFSASVDGDDLDKVVLLRGSAFEDDSYDDTLSSFEMKRSRTAFVALSPYGCNGMIELMNSTFILSTPDEIFDNDEHAERRASKNEYVSSLRNQAQNFLPHMKNTLKDFNMNHVSVIFNSAILDGPVSIPNYDQILPPPPPQGLFDDEEYKAIKKRSTPFDSSKEMIKTFRIATDIDYDMFKRKGSNRFSTVIYYYTLVAHCGSIFKRDFGHNFVSSYLNIYSQPDPYPNTVNDCFLYMQKTWNPNTPARSFAALISAKGLGGGGAYLGSLCDKSYGYAINGNMVGSYPIPVTNFHPDNWDIYVFSHEVGHVFGAQHTHDLVPPVDRCGITPSCPATKGTIMSYCHGCAGGMTNIELVFHQRNKDEVIASVQNKEC